MGDSKHFVTTRNLSSLLCHNTNDTLSFSTELQMKFNSQLKCISLIMKTKVKLAWIWVTLQNKEFYICLKCPHFK